MIIAMNLIVIAETWLQKNEINLKMKILMKILQVKQKT